jgi:hypothetical protein
MSTRNNSALLWPAYASTVLGITLRNTERSQQLIQLGDVGTVDMDSEMRALSQQQLGDFGV